MIKKDKKEGNQRKAMMKKKKKKEKEKNENGRNYEIVE